MSDSPPQQPLEYRSPPDADEAPRPPFGAGVGAVIGFTLYVVAVFLLVAFAMFAMPPFSTFVMAALASLAAMVVFSVYSNARWGWRGLFVGILAGLGLTLLIPGLCFVGMMLA